MKIQIRKNVPGMPQGIVQRFETLGLEFVPGVPKDVDDKVAVKLLSENPKWFEVVASPSAVVDPVLGSEPKKPRRLKMPRSKKE